MSRWDETIAPYRQDHCYCLTCDRYIHRLGIMNHRKGHCLRGEHIQVMYKNRGLKDHGPKDLETPRKVNW